MVPISFFRLHSITQILITHALTSMNVRTQILPLWASSKTEMTNSQDWRSHHKRLNYRGNVAYRWMHNAIKFYASTGSQTHKLRCYWVPWNQTTGPFHMDEDNARRVALGGSTRPVAIGRAAVVCCLKKVGSMYILEKNNLSPPYDLNFWNRLHHCVLCDEGNKTRSHLHIFW